jgi:hypothetical protein
MKELINLIIFTVGTIPLGSAITSPGNVITEHHSLEPRQDTSLCESSCGLIWGANDSCETVECECTILTFNGSASTCANCLMNISGNETLASTIEQLVAACLLMPGPSSSGVTAVSLSSVTNASGFTSCSGGCLASATNESSAMTGLTSAPTKTSQSTTSTAAKTNIFRTLYMGLYFVILLSTVMYSWDL